MSTVSLSYCSLRITTIRKCGKGTKGCMNLPRGCELKQSQWAWKIWLLFCQLTAEHSERQIFRNYGEPDDWPRRRWGERELSTHGNSMLIQRKLSARLFTLYLLPVKKCALARIAQLYNHTVRSYPALNQAKLFKVHSRLNSVSWHSADSLPQTTCVALVNLNSFSH